MPESVLIVEDETIVALHLERTVISLGYSVSDRARTAEEALAAARKCRPAVALLDVRIQGEVDGIDLAAQLRRELGLPVIFLTAHTDGDTLARARSVTPAGFVVKPFTAEDVKAALAMVLPAGGLAAKRSQPFEAPTPGLPGMVGDSRAIRDVYEQVRAIATVDWTVLIEGETGTGKELVARAIHSTGPRSSGPFVAVNCAGLSESLAASQLFGHRRGAFTGAEGHHRGVFESAEGGTLFLDEIGDVPPSVQAALLRVLEDRRVTPLGDTQEREVDVRLLAATHRDLDASVRAGRFRQDLLYRLRVASLCLPPLRKRRSDLRALAEHFLARAAADSKRPVVGFSQAAIAALEAHSWPGNVRELEGVVARAVLRAEGRQVEVTDLPPDLEAAGDPAAERDRIRATLAAVAGNRVRAAEKLGISRATLYRRLSEFGIE